MQTDSRSAPQSAACRSEDYSKDYTVDSSVEAGTKATENAYIATAKVEAGEAQAADFKQVTDITSGKQYLITMGDYVVTNNAEYNYTHQANGLTIKNYEITSANAVELSKYLWTITEAGTNSYTVVDANGQYLNISSTGNGYKGSVTLSSASTALNVKKYNDSGKVAFYNSSNYYLDNFGGVGGNGYNTLASAWYTTSPADNNKWTLYEVVEGTSAENKLTITGTGEGDTTATIGGVTYNIKPEAKTFVDACRKPFQYVILDTPPAGLLADASEAAALADAAILTVRQNYASKTQILEAVRSLTDSQLPILGCVINYATNSTLAGGYYGYGYGKGYRGYGEKESSARGR